MQEPMTALCTPLQARRESFASEVAEASLRVSTLEERLAELRSWEAANKTQLAQVVLGPQAEGTSERSMQHDEAQRYIISLPVLFSLMLLPLSCYLGLSPPI